MKKINLLVLFLLVFCMSSNSVLACGNFNEIEFEQNNSVEQVSVMSSCSHNWSAWQVYRTEKIDGKKFGDCKIRRTTWLRACQNCGELEYKDSDYQLDHSWQTTAKGLKKCVNCGMTTGTLEFEDDMYE